jgi:hypothetical protein
VAVHDHRAGGVLGSVLLLVLLVGYFVYELKNREIW